MRASIKFSAVLAGMVFSVLGHAQTDLIGSITPGPGGTVIEVGMSSDQAVKGLQFDITAPKGVSFRNADLGGCLSDLPKAFSASTCTQINDGTIRVVVLSLSGADVPSGFLGQIIVPGPTVSGGEKVEFARESASMHAALDKIDFTNVVIGGAGGSRIDADFVGMAVDQ